VRVGGGIGSGYFIEVDKDKNTDPSTKRSKSFSENQRRKDESSIQRSSTIVSSQESRPAATSTDDDDAPAHVYMYELYSKNAMPLSKILPAKRLTPMDNNFHPTVALQALTSILTDPSLAVYHEMVMKAVMFILNSLGVRCVPFLKGIVPHIIHTTRSCGQAFLRETLFKQIATLSSIVKENLKAYVPDIFELIKEFWDSKHLATVLALVEKLAAAVPAEFKKYVPDLISRFLVSIDDFVAGTWLKNSSTPLSQALKRLALMTKSIRTLIVTLGDYLHMLLPALLKLTDSLISPSIKYERSSNVSRQHRGVDTLQTVAALLQIGDKNDLMGSGSKKMTGIGTSTKHFRPTLAAGSAQTIMRILSKTPGTSKDIGYELINTLCVCACTIGKEQWMLLYNERALEVIILWYNRANLNVNHYMTLEHETFREELSQSLGLERYCLLLSQPSFEQSLEMLADPSAIASSTAIIGEENRANMIAGEVRRSDPDMFRSSSSTHAIHNQSNRHIVNQVKLQRAWNISQSATREECDEWMRRFSLALLRESPAPALRACYELANAYQPLARELFRAAFDNCWTELTDECRKSLINALKIVFKKADPSPEILQTLLNLAEFAERDGIKGGLPIEIDILANLALNCQAYAKALHYKELEHLRPGGSACIEDLISINKKLDLPGKLILCAIFINRLI
jgi:FKBP12-rapamycin complex-associated protein